MKTYIGRVVNSIDPEYQGNMMVSINNTSVEDGDMLVSVSYVSPAAGPTGGGFIAPVDEGSLVLITTVDNDSGYYYMGTVMEGIPRGNPNVYSAGQRITSTGLTSKEGAGLEVTTEISESSFRQDTRVKGAGGQGQMIINTHPGNESVTLQAAGMNSKVKLTGAHNTSPDKIEIDANKSVISRSRSGSNTVNVGPKGGEIKIHNEGSPFMPFRTGPMQPFNGDIRIESENNNVIIKSCAEPALIGTDTPDGGGVTIQAGTVPNALTEIRVDSQGMVYIIGALGIKMESSANIDLNAVGQVNIKGAQVNLQPTPAIAPMLPIPPSKR